MKNYKYIFIGIIIVLIIAGIVFYFYKNNNNSVSDNENNNVEYSRTSTEDNNINNNDTNNNTTEETNVAEEKKPENEVVKEPPVEEDLSSFSTKIYSKDSARQKNLQITSSTLNGTIVEPGKTFSFTKTIGRSTPEKGYEEADIYDENGNKVKGYGGGNCQISSTLYNAVLQLSSLKVTERHPHSQKVPYVKEGKDAAVYYGSVDFKFKNNYEFPIKIYCSIDKSNVYVRIVKLL